MMRAIVTNNKPSSAVPTCVLSMRRRKYEAVARAENECQRRQYANLRPVVRRIKNPRHVLRNDAEGAVNHD